MKTLYFRRHSMKDGPANTCGKQGIALAIREGRRFSRETASGGLDLIFNGILTRTAQTGWAFSLGWAYHDTRMPRMAPPIPEFGDDVLFSDKGLVIPGWREEAAKSSFFRATRVVHGEERARVFAAERGLASVNAIANLMRPDESAVGFAHSPVVELAAWACLGYPETLPPQFDGLSDLEGIKFEETGAGTFVPVARISVVPFNESDLQLLYENVDMAKDN